MKFEIGDKAKHGDKLCTIVAIDETERLRKLWHYIIRYEDGTTANVSKGDLTIVTTP